MTNSTKKSKKNIWLSMLLPSGFHATWLLLLMLGGIMYFWSQGHFDVVKQYLDTDQFTFAMGNFKISAYMALKAVISIIVIFWTTSIILAFVDKRLMGIKNMRAANRVLIQKILQIFIYFIAFLMTMNILGINLTSLTVLSGALGIGLGFGLQKVASNFVSGMILLIERSLKPNDLIELEDGTFGYVRKSSSRSTLLETLDGKEIIIPNEEFIIKKVVNWTLNNSKARIDIPFGVSYEADIKKAQELGLAAAKDHPRCLQDPEPQCLLRNFGNSSVDFIIMFWIDDITKGRWNAQSEVMFDLWNRLKEHNIEIPFPQQDLHIKSSDVDFSTRAIANEKKK